MVAHLPRFVLARIVDRRSAGDPRTGVLPIRDSGLCPDVLGAERTEPDQPRPRPFGDILLRCHPGGRVDGLIADDPASDSDGDER